MIDSSAGLGSYIECGVEHYKAICINWSRVTGTPTFGDEDMFRYVTTHYLSSLQQVYIYIYIVIQLYLLIFHLL